VERADTNGKRALLAEFKGQHREWVPIEDLKIWRKYGNKKVQVPGTLDGRHAFH
jgi:hypothetical protein